jgi:hypothetical protein
MSEECPVYYRLLVTRDKAVVACMQDFDENDYNASRRITNQKFDTEDEALAFAKRAYNHPECPEHVKEFLRPLLKQDVNVDWLFDE